MSKKSNRYSVAELLLDMELKKALLIVYGFFAMEYITVMGLLLYYLKHR